MERTTFTVLFFIKRTKLTSDGTAPIYLRVTVNGTRCETSIGHGTLIEQWNGGGQRIQSNSRTAREINDHLDSSKSRLRTIRTHQQDLGISVTARSIMDEFLGKGSKHKSIKELFEEHNAKMSELIKVGQISPPTLRRYKDALNHLTRYTVKEYRTDSFMIGNVDHEFVVGFEHYLKVVAENQHNTAMKHIKGFRKIVRHALSTQLIVHDPFSNYQMPIKPTIRERLTLAEVRLMQEKDFGIPRIAIVRDLFILQCFTGIAYADLAGLTKDNIQVGPEGKPCIRVSRKKTGEPCFIPLLPDALEILNRYSDHPICVKNGKLLPVPSNQKMNSYLKEIGDLCGIKKELTTHLARHTFATMALSKGMPMEVVSKLLGHSDLKTTKIYAKLQDERVSSEMDAFAGRLAK